MRPWRKAAIVGSAVASLLAYDAEAATNSMALCKAVSARIPALPPLPTDVWVAGPIEHLARTRPDFVRLDDRKPDYFQAQPDAEAEIRATTRRLMAVPRISQDFSDYHFLPEDRIRVRKLGDTRVRAVEFFDSGTMHCAYFYFFSKRGGKVRAEPDPPDVLARLATGEAPSGYCVADHAALGSIGGAPAFVTENQDTSNYDYDLSITAWDGRRWLKPCAIEVKYRKAYRVEQAHCQGATCQPLRRVAFRLANALQAHEDGPRSRDDFLWPETPHDTAMRTEALRKQIRSFGGGPLPDVPEEHKDIAEDMGDSREVFPLRLAGQDYVAMLGHYGVGWRVFPDFVLLLYDRVDGKARIVASVKLESRQGALASVRYGRWRSTHGAINPNKTALY